MTTKHNSTSTKRGVTLVEVMLASAITSTLVLVLLETMIFGARIAKANSQLLAADAYAFDVAWRHCNESFALMPSNLRRHFHQVIQIHQKIILKKGAVTIKKAIKNL